MLLSDNVVPANVICNVACIHVLNLYMPLYTAFLETDFFFFYLNYILVGSIYCTVLCSDKVDIGKCCYGTLISSYELSFYGGNIVAGNGEVVTIYYYC